ncbi:MAG: hypothetical protein O7E52_16815 [Candidatus Poribacteria bacterium]|nr:hypothetical protein [Candidatus Poribacteria bacterium]
MSGPSKSQKIQPFIINQIAQSLFGDRFIIIYDNTIQFHNHCYHVKRLADTAHPYCGHYYLLDANTQLAMQTDVDFAAPGSYGAIFDSTTGEIVGYDEPKAL